MHRALGFAVVVAACSSPSGKSDAGGADAGPIMFQGEYVDWDSTNDAGFCGIPGATYTVKGASTGSSTPPNGRLMVTIPAGVDEIDFTPPTDPSPCAAGSGTYGNPGLLIVDAALVAKGIDYSLRSFTTMRRDAFYTGLGLTYDATKAQVFVNVQGTASAPAITATHAATAAYDGTTWAAGASGVYVLFPNVDVSAATTALTATGASGSQTLPLVAGTITYAAVSN